jgi:hypothetical protein
MRFSQFVMLSSLPQHSRIAPLVSYTGDLLMRLLSVKGLVIILVVTFLHNFAFNAGTFYLALYYQVYYFLSGPPTFFSCSSYLRSGNERHLTCRSRNDVTTLFSWSVLVVHASRLVYWFLATQKSGHERTKVGDICGLDYFDVRLR